MTFADAERFVRAEARLLDQRLFETCFRGAPASAVVDALRGYRNTDGGFGYGLEPDKRVPHSLPIDVEIAFQTLAAAGADAPDLLGPACDWLTSVTVDGAVPMAFPIIEDYPRAAHWTDWTYQPGVNPTAGLAALLHRLGFAHPWRDAATAYCWRVVEAGDIAAEVHGLAEVMSFLAEVPERDRAAKHAAGVLDRLRADSMFHLDPDADGYGLTPLQIAPTPGSPWRDLFTDAQIDGHLDRLEADQQPDGGWPITWDPPSVTSRQEWRGIVTVGAVRTLTAYGRMSPQA